MITLYDKLSSARKAPAVQKTAAPSVVEIDAEGAVKLAEALESVAVGQNKGLNGLLKIAAKAVRQLSSEKEYLVGELAGAMHKESASKFAGELVRRGVCTDKELDEVVGKMLKVGNLDAVRQALDIVQPKPPLQMGQAEKSAAGAPKDPATRKFLEDPAVQFLLEKAV